jgi:glycosyltransferase involved in cell wall biosynthesis
MLAQNPMITVAIPTYQRPRLLERALRSVLNQTYPHFQVCVYDNASGDETQEIVAKFMEEDHRVRYFCKSSNIGPYACFEYALNRIATPYFSFLCDDDAYLPDFFESALKKFAQYPAAMFAAGVMLVVKDNAIIEVTSPVSGIDEYFTPPQSLIEITPDPPVWPSILFRREAIDRVGTFDVETEWAFDSDFLYRIAARCPIILTKQPWGVFLMHAESISGRVASTMAEKRVFGMKKLIENISSDDIIPLDARRAFVQKLQSYCTDLTYSEGFKAVRYADYEYAYQMAHSLDVRFREKGKARIIRVLIFLHKHFVTGYHMLRVLNTIGLDVAELRRKNGYKRLQRDYGRYLQPLDQMSPKNGM